MDQSGNTQVSPLFLCYSTNLVTSNGVWVANSVSDVINLYSYPLLIVQLCLLVISTRVLAIALRPLRQPRVIAEMLGGILIGPSLLGRYYINGWNIGELIFPQFSISTLETLSRVGVLYYLFIVGVGIDLESIRRTGKKATTIAGVSVALPFVLCMLAAPFLLHHNHKSAIGDENTGDDDVSHLASHMARIQANSTGAAVATFASGSASEVLLGIALSITSIPVLARILTDIRMLNTEIGRLALSSSIFNNVLSWTLLALAMSFASGHKHNVLSWRTFGVLCSAVGLVFCLIKVVRPGLKWLARRTDEGRPVDSQYLGLILVGVAASGAVSDAVGLHPFFGAFLFGVVFPSGPLAMKVLEMTEESAISYLTTLFFVSTGFKINAFNIQDMVFARGVIIIFFAASCVKIVGAIFVARFCGMHLRQGIALGFMINTKGMVHILILSMGIDRKVVEVEALPLFTLLAVVTTALVPPVVMATEKPSKRQLARHRRRNVQVVKTGSEMRVLACLHAVKNVPSLVSLLDASNPTKRSPVFVHALHLIELVGRATAMLIVHQNGRQQHRGRGSGHAESEQIASALEQYEQQAGGVSVQTLTAIAPYSTMHEDICALAEEKRVNLIILPFHNQPTGDGGDRHESSIREVNQKVLSSARCSVAILVDRGLGVSGRFRLRNQTDGEVVLLFFGGPDDREALAFASRMAEHPNIHLTVLRFRAESMSEEGDEEERVLDEHCMNEFRMRHMKNESVVYWERVVGSSEETVAAVRSIDSLHDLYVVGRGRKGASPLTAALEEWSECPELGPIGDLLASSDFGALVSVLVFQQYEVFTAEGAAEVGESPRRLYGGGGNGRGWNSAV